MRFFFTSCLFFFCFWWTASFGQPGPAKKTYAAHSVLSTGNWYKIGLTGSGLYKLDRNLLKALGLPVNNLDPRHLQVYGNGGAMLPQRNNQLRPDDLQQNAVFIQGESDGRFDANDYMLLYAPGPHRWQYQSNSGRFVHQTNIYSDTAYYFITLGAAPGRRVAASSPAGLASDTINTYIDLLYWEQDQVNLLKSGRNWYGEAFNALHPSRTFSFALPDITAGSTIYLTSSVVGNAEAGSLFEVEANNHLLGTQIFQGRGSQDYHAEGETDTRTFALGASQVSGKSLQVKLSYKQQGSATATGYLDYLEINAERPLKLVGQQTAFRSTRHLGTGKIVSYKIREVSSDAAVWEVSNPVRPRPISLEKHGNTAAFTAKADSLREYLVFAGKDFPSPFPLGQVQNQNLHGINQDGRLDLLILSHPRFMGQASQLAQHRRQKDNLQVEVVSTTQVYNEFSSGSQDVTAIRDFMKMLFDRRNSQGYEKPLYLLLFGDASYDYKSRIQYNTNFVPVYESRESLDPLTTYSSEDFYGLLDEEEGEWSEINFSTTELIDIGIGRLPVKSINEAQAVVSKILHYDSAASFGKWRNNITLLADDGDGGEHLRDAENLAQYLETSQPAFLPQKLYLDLYQQQSLPHGQRSPAATAALNQAIEQGTLLLNYTGHGNETTLAHEELLTLPQIASWKNYDRLVFMLTATCEFGRYDDPKRSSGAELALLNPQGGAIGLLSTTRPVYASTNRLLNRNFIQMAFTPVNGRPPRLGDLFVKTKNNSQAQANNRNFTLLGDPSQQLAYPSLKAQVTSINNHHLSSGFTDTLRALQQVNLSGNITDNTNALQQNFNGIIEVTIFDKPITVKPLGDEISETDPVPQNILIRESVIYSGTATVANGVWSLNFVVPKDISYTMGHGFISLYAYNGQTDAHGQSSSLVIGGSSLALEDKTPPQIRLYMDDESFIPGGLTNQNPILIAHLFDTNGINTTGTGIGHEITATLDGNKSNILVLNSYYLAEKDNFMAGQIRYPFKDLSIGWHELSLKAWDTHNNPAEARLRFQVTDSRTLVLGMVKAFPNPFTDHITFQLDHNRTNEDLDIQIQVFNVTGKAVKHISAHQQAGNAQQPQINWDGRDDSGAELPPGIYLYRLNLRSTGDGSQAQNFSRLIKIN